jgi:uncharacterized membrane protein
MGETRRKLPWKKFLLTGLFSALATILLFVVVVQLSAHGGNQISLPLLAIPFAPAIGLGFLFQTALAPFVSSGGSEFGGLINTMGLFILGTAIGVWLETWIVLLIGTWIWKRLKNEKVEK